MIRLKILTLTLLTGACALTFMLVGCSVAWNTHTNYVGAKEAPVCEGEKMIDMGPPGVVTIDTDQGSEAESRGRAAADANVNSPNATASGDASGDNADAPPE